VVLSGRLQGQGDIKSLLELSAERNHNVHGAAFALDAKCVSFGANGSPNQGVDEYEKIAATQPATVFKVFTHGSYLVAESDLLVIVVTPRRSFVLRRTRPDESLSIANMSNIYDDDEHGFEIRDAARRQTGGLGQLLFVNYLGLLPNPTDESHRIEKVSDSGPDAVRIDYRRTKATNINGKVGLLESGYQVRKKSQDHAVQDSEVRYAGVPSLVANKYRYHEFDPS
jgi:hypothetical protein